MGVEEGEPLDSVRDIEARPTWNTTSFENNLTNGRENNENGNGAECEENGTLWNLH